VDGASSPPAFAQDDGGGEPFEPAGAIIFKHACKLGLE
jgi:hypothetical protein